MGLGTALSFEVTAWLNTGCDCQLWHPAELPPSETLLLKMSLAHTCLMLLSPKAAPALCDVCVTCISTTEIKRKEYYVEEK